MSFGELRNRLWPIVEPIVEDEGLALVELEFVRQSGSWILRIYMDGPEGIRVEDCERVSRRLSPVLDVEDVIPHSYTLEVSSPGIPRPLRKAQDFERFSGEIARIEMASPCNGRKRFTGELAGVSEGEEGEVALKLDGGETVRLPVTDIRRARLAEEVQGAHR